MRQAIEVIRKIVNWLFRIFIWLIIEPKKFWITLLLPIFVGVIVCWFNPVGISNEPKLIDILEKRFRLTGLALELSGIVLVVLGLNETLKLFLGEHLLHIIPKWFKRFPKFGDNPHIVVSSINDMLNVFVSSSTTKIPAPNSSIEIRVAYLEEHIKEVLSQVQKNKIHSENELKKMSDALNVERSEREDGDKQGQEKVTKYAVADVYKELMGIFWLFTGAISATASTELAKYFG